MSQSKRRDPSQLELPLGVPDSPIPRALTLPDGGPVSTLAVLVSAPSPTRVRSERVARLPSAPRSPESAPARPALRVIDGGGKRQREPLDNRDAVVRVLVEAGADLLLRRISSDRAEEIQRQVDRILALFDAVDGAPAMMPMLQRRLDELEQLMRETRASRGRRQGG